MNKYLSARVCEGEQMCDRYNDLCGTSNKEGNKLINSVTLYFQPGAALKQQKHFFDSFIISNIIDTYGTHRDRSQVDAKK